MHLIALLAWVRPRFGNSSNVNSDAFVLSVVLFGVSTLKYSKGATISAGENETVITINPSSQLKDAIDCIVCFRDQAIKNFIEKWPTFTVSISYLYFRLQARMGRFDRRVSGSHLITLSFTNDTNTRIALFCLFACCCFVQGTRPGVFHFSKHFEKQKQNNKKRSGLLQ